MEKIKNKKTYQFQAEMEQLLDLLAHSLYTNKEIFLRELVSNASDTLNKLRFLSLTDVSVLENDSELKININIDEKEKTISIEDNGMGMTEKELQDNLGTIAKSGTMNFLKQLKKNQNLEQIGKFGVGFYSVFMVTDKVKVETRNYKSKKAFRWISEGKNQFTIESIEKKNRGTKIFFQLKKESEDFASPYFIETIIKKYSNFVSFPILVNKEQKNDPVAIWKKSKPEIKEQEYKEFFQHLSRSNEEPLITIHYSVEAPVQFQAILFASQDKEQNPFHPDNQNLNRLHLYIKRIFIQDDCKNLVPKWIRFLYGVVDTEDLQLNVSREVTQNSPVIGKISQLLAKKVIAEFQKIKKSNEKKFLKIWDNFGLFIKEGIYSDFQNKEKLLEIYHLHSSQCPKELTSLDEVIARKKEDVKEIYYIYGKNQSAIEQNPNTEYFAKKGIEILYLYDELDTIILSTVGEYKGVNFLPVDKIQVEKPAPSGEKEDKFLIYCKDILGDKVSDVVTSSRLVQSPCSLVSSKDAMDTSMVKMMQMMQKDFQIPKKVFEINLANPLIQQIQKIRAISSQDSLVKDIILQLYDNAKLIEESSEQAEFMVPRLQKIMTDYTKTYLTTIKEKNKKSL